MSDRESTIARLEQRIGARLSSPYRERLAASDPEATGTIVLGEYWFGLEEARHGRELEIWRAIGAEHPDFADWARCIDG